MDIVADIGGTNARFACYTADPSRQSAGKLFNSARYICADFPSMADALTSYFEDFQIKPMRMSLAVAGPVDGPSVSFTNNHWSFLKREVKSRFSLSSLTVVNDFTAQALVPPYLAKKKLISVRDGTPYSDTPILVLGAGTGLGFAALMPVADDWRPLETEGGNALLSLQADDPETLPAFLRKKEEVVSFETCLSGRGLEYLYQFLDEGQPALTAKQIAETADSNQQAHKAILLFFNILANFIANGILSTGARQGVYISGGIVPKLKEFLPHSQFLSRLSAHGAYSDYVGAVPVYLIDGEQAEQAGLLGAGLALANPYLNHRRG